MVRDERQGARDVDMTTGSPIRAPDVVDAEWREVKPALYRKLPKARPPESMSWVMLLVALVVVVVLLGLWRAWTDSRSRVLPPPARLSTLVVRPAGRQRRPAPGTSRVRPGLGTGLPGDPASQTVVTG